MFFRRTFQKNFLRFVSGRAPWSRVLKNRATWKNYRKSFLTIATHFQEEIHTHYNGQYHANIEKVFSRVPRGRVFLKIDIEGSEYGIIEDVLRYVPRITGIAIEFHSTYALRETFCAAIRKLQSSFHIVHVHPNNYGFIGADGLPDTLEMTFSAGSLPSSARRRLRLPLADLDRPNKAGSPEIELQFSE